MKTYLWPLAIVTCALVSGRVLATVHYVDLSCTNAMSPYTDWNIAATNIQDAIDVSTNGDLILVSNGIYQTGGRVISPLTLPTNRVVINKAVTVQSVNGPTVTVIQGNPVRGSNAVRCVYLTFGATLSGFTLAQGGATCFNPLGDDFHQSDGGGGVWCWWPLKAMVTNCVLSNNIAIAGGGAYGCILNNCVLISNAVYYNAGWNAPGSGGGVRNSYLTNCILVGNSGQSGGGAYGSRLNNCLLSGNQADSGGGAYQGTLNNCTIIANSASNRGGGTYSNTLWNCIVYDNRAPNGTNHSGGILNYCCTIPLPTNAAGNITNDPALVDFANGDFHLQSNSPCINSGNNAYVPAATDLDGNSRIVGGTVDMGAYECQSPALLAYYTWLQNYGLPTDASTVYADADGDGMNNWQEWRTGTIPTDALSLLQMTAVTNAISGMTVTWQSVSNITYFLQRSSDLLV